MHPTTRDAFTAWVAAAAIWFPMALAVYELLNFLSGHPFGLGIQNPLVFVISGTVAAGFIAVAAGYIARQRVISQQTRRGHGD